jgi:hypothetical protein
MIKVIVKKDLLPNDYPTIFVDPVIHKMSRTRDMDRRSDVNTMCVVSVPYVRGVSEKFEKG